MSNIDSCRQKILSVIHNMTENPKVCGMIQVSTYIQNINCILESASNSSNAANSENIVSNRSSASSVASQHHIIELILKSLINMSRYEEDSLSDVDLKDLFKRIAELYPEFNVLSRQYALRLMTILTTQWN